MSDRPPRWARVLLTAQSALLVLVGLAALVLALTGAGLRPSTDVQLPVLRVNPVHGAVLLVVGVAGLAAAQRLRPLLWSCAAQGLLFLLLFLYGAGRAEGGSTVLRLDGPENLLHGALVVVALVVGVVVLSVSRTRSRAQRR